MLLLCGLLGGVLARVVAMCANRVIVRVLGVVCGVGDVVVVVGGGGGVGVVVGVVVIVAVVVVVVMVGVCCGGAV